jgi:transcription elongation factor S-II
MASDAKKRERTKTKRDALEACQSDWDVRNIKRAEGQFPCGKCHSSNTTYFQLQTRSSDEPMTT